MTYVGLSTSPRKVIPLSGGISSDMQRTKSEGSQPSAPTRRAYFCAVVVEGGQHGQPLAQDVQELITSLGEPMSPKDTKAGMERSSSAPDVMGTVSLADMSNDPSLQTRKRSLTASSALQDVINELVSTERSYVARLHTLKNAYADPLKTFARSKDSAILPAYEAKTLFGNIDQILPANEAFLADLEKMVLPNGHKLVGGVGDVALKHLKDLRAFDCYKQYYAKREEAQTIFEREMAKKSTTGFAGFIDRIKYSSTDKNRVGLRELLMDPVQRIPRYTLMFRTMIKHMSPTDPQRQRILEADEIASKIALFETDDQTKRATIMYCLQRSIEGFPANLISNGRRFIDCIDVEDVPVDSPANGFGYAGDGPGAPIVPLQCTLFLFDDRLLIVKRPSGGGSGRALSGLDEMDRVARMGGLLTNIKKDVMSCKGVVDVTELVATDVSGPDFHLFLEDPPEDQSDRWSGRPFRSLSVVHPPHPPNFDPVLTKHDKQRFLQNLWTAQALYRVKGERSVALAGWAKEMPAGKGKQEIIRTYFNVYQRMDWLREPKKCKVVVHIDALGSADPLPFGVNGPPLVIARAQPMAGELCRYTVTSSDPSDEGEEDIIHNATLHSRIVQTIHQFGVFKFRTGRMSTPGTPTASNSTRSRAAIFGLDAISRTLKTSDVFGIGSLSSSHRRAKSSTSRASTYTLGTESSVAKSSRSNSTAGTSISVMEMDDNRTDSKMRRGRSPGPSYGMDSGSDPELLERPSSRLKYPVQKKTGKLKDERPWYAAGAQEDWNETEDEMDVDDGDRDRLRPHGSYADTSIVGLDERLELARQNSQTQESGPVSHKVKRKPVPFDARDDGISEDPSTGGLSMLAQSGSSSTGLSISHYPPSTRSREAESITPTPSYADGRPLSPTKSRTGSTHRSRSVTSTSSDRESRRPMGPRAISPMPTGSRPRSPELKAADIEAVLRKTFGQPSSRPITPCTTGSTSLSRQSTSESQRPTSPSLDSDRPLSPSLIPTPVTAPFRPTTPIERYRSKTPSHDLPPIPAPGPVRTATIEIERAASPVPPWRRLVDALDKTPQALPPLSIMTTPKAVPPLDLSLAPRTPVDLHTSTPVPPLSIKKKAPQSPPSTARKINGSPSIRNTRRLSAQPKQERKETVEDLMDDLESKTLPSDSEMLPTAVSAASSSVWQITSLAQSTRDDISSSRRSVKKIKLEVDTFRSTLTREVSSKDKTIARLTKASTAIPRSPHSRDIANKAAEARMEEMRLMISARGGRPMSQIPVPSSSLNAGPSTAGSASADLSWLEDWSRKMEELTNQADHDLQQASSKHENLLADFKALAQQFEEKTREVDRTRGELGRAKKQCELVKKLLADATAENEIMYEAFNEELDGMFNDAELPETEAWDALTRDLRKAKEARNSFAKDNASLKRKLEEAELQNKQWEELLRSHGLIS